MCFKCLSSTNVFIALSKDIQKLRSNYVFCLRPGFDCTKCCLPNSYCLELFKHVQGLVIPILKFSVKSLYISCDFNIPRVIVFHAFSAAVEKNHYVVDVPLSYNRLLCNCCCDFLCDFVLDRDVNVWIDSDLVVCFCA